MMFLLALVVPTACAPKLKAFGFRLTGSSAIPVRLIACGLLLALSLMFTVPVSAPLLAGANVTEIAHWPLAGMLVPQLFSWLYAVDPLIEMLMFVKGTF